MYSLKRYVNAEWITYGPYSCRFVPITGQDRMGLPGHLIDADDRIFFPLYAPVTQNDIARRIETNQTWTILFAVPLDGQLEVWAKRSVMPAAGTKG
jgi:hypothetical protein